MGRASLGSNLAKSVKVESVHTLLQHSSFISRHISLKTFELVPLQRCKNVHCSID